MAWAREVGHGQERRAGRVVAERRSGPAVASRAGRSQIGRRSGAEREEGRAERAGKERGEGKRRKRRKEKEKKGREKGKKREGERFAPKTRRSVGHARRRAHVSATRGSRKNRAVDLVVGVGSNRDREIGRNREKFPKY